MPTDWYSLREEERYESLVSILNHDIRNVILAYALDDQLKTKDDIREGFARVVDVEAKGLLLPLRSSFDSYCRKTFVPIGMVAEERYRRKGHQITTGWKLSEAGKNIGRYAAAHAIRTACTFGISLYRILGPTYSPGNHRSPYNTIRLLEELERGSDRVVDLSLEIGPDAGDITQHLLRLKEAEIIEFRSLSPEEKIKIKYRWKDGKPEDAKIVGGQKTLTTRVSELLYSGGEWDRTSVCKELKYSNRGGVSTLLTDLEKQGLIERTDIFAHPHKLSHVILRDRGRRFLKAFKDPIKTTATNVEPALELKESLSAHSNWEIAYRENTLASVMYCNASRRFTAHSGEERKIEIVNLLRSEGRMRHIDIDKRVGVGCGAFLRELAEKGIVVKEKEERAVWYEITE